MRLRSKRWWLLALPAFATVGLELVIRARPFPREDLTAGPPQSVRIYDRGGELLREVVNEDGERSRWLALEELSPLVVQATLAAEDDRFYAHPGVDAQAVARALWLLVSERRIASGASTLTMQLARRVHPHPRTFVGKLDEMLDALRLERAFGKRDILEQYLNRVPYGAGAIGVEAASLRYFGKPSRHLSLAEAAMLAGLPKSPTDLNPLKSLDAARARQAWVLERMATTGRAAATDVALAQREPLVLSRLQPPSAMHFTDWVRSEAHARELHTTLDATLQREVEQMVADHVQALRAQGVTNSAVVVLDNARCEVLAMVGSADYWDPRDGRVNGALARRQPGSTLKPFTYALAYERGKAPNSTVADVETRYGEAGGELFKPQNFSHDFSGPVLFHEALGRSLNVPAIRIAAGLGAPDLLERLHAAGFGSLDQPAAHYGLGLTLGNGEVTLLELAQAYAMLARRGEGCTAQRLLAPGDAPTARVFSEEVAYLVTDALADEGTRMRAFGPDNALMLGFPVAVKTGTSTNWRDNWAVGFTPRHTVAVWAGDFDNRPLNQIAGASGAGPLFHRVMKRVALRDGQSRPEAFAAPEGVVEASVCATSGQRATAQCPERRTVKLPKGQLPTHACEHHRELAVDVRNGLLAGPRCPSRWVERRTFEVLPAPYAQWQAEHPRRAPPTAWSPLCPREGVVPGAVVVTWPRRGEVFLVEPGYVRATQSVELSAEVEPRAELVQWWLDGAVVARVGWPYKASWPLAAGKHRLVAESAGRRSEPVEFEVR